MQPAEDEHLFRWCLSGSDDFARMLLAAPSARALVCQDDSDSELVEDSSESHQAVVHGALWSACETPFEFLLAEDELESEQADAIALSAAASAVAAARRRISVALNVLKPTVNSKLPPPDLQLSQIEVSELLSAHAEAKQINRQRSVVSAARSEWPPATVPAIRLVPLLPFWAESKPVHVDPSIDNDTMSAFAPTPNLLRRWFGDAPESVSILPPDQPVAAAATGVNPTRAIVHTPTTTSPLSSITACSAKLHWFWDVSIGGTGGQLLQRILWSALLLLTAIGFPVVSLPDEPFYIINTIVSVIMFSCMAYALMCMVFSVDVVLLRLVWQQFDSIAMLLCALAVLGLWIKQNLRNDNHLQFGVQIGWAFMWFIMFMLLLSYDAAPVLLRRTKITASMLYIAGTIATWVRFSFYSSHSFSVIDPPLLCALRNPSACVPTHVIIIDLMVFMGLFIIRGMFSLFANVRLDRPPSLAFVRSTVAVAALHTEVESSDENDIELQEAIAASIPTSTAVTATTAATAATAALPASMIEIEPVDVQAERAVARTKRRITKAKKHVQIMVESKSASRNSSEGMREAIAASVALSDESQFVDPLVAVRRLPSWASSFTPAPRFAYLFTTQFEAEYDSNIFSNRAAWHWSLLQQLLNAAPLPVRLSMALLTTVMLILNLAAQPTNVVFLCLIYVISLLLVRVALHNIDISVFRVLLGSFEFWLPVSALLVAVAVEIYQLSLFGNFRFARLSSTESALASAVWLFNYTFFSVVCLAADSLVPLARLWRALIVTLFMLFQLQLFVQYFLFGSTGDGDSGHLSICAWHSCTTAATLRAEACLVMALFAVKHIATLVASPTAMGALRTGVGMRRVRL